MSIYVHIYEIYESPKHVFLLTNVGTFAGKQLPDHLAKVDK
jgi:hypothetical protein